ncbi:predicted protein [Lichtheimia corymbifera JMRC:FSU:9682]|uniref:Uncharacterized protein n=1 Tax=Lichtheimia corymbifera JMRC:FSU:9682 TaxID=1263082 RepID=A0A068RHL8_9FUNG|nr:predicted protein [Lichtheimia corymbifera JMRC:FSU:9682]
MMAVFQISPDGCNQDEGVLHIAQIDTHTKPSIRNPSTNAESWNVVLVTWHVVSKMEGSYHMNSAEDGDGLERH